MSEFAAMIDLPLVWAGVLAFAVFLYVVLDGFDLGIGVLFPLGHDDDERGLMMNTVAPVWDGNETWLVLGGGGLMAAFPAAYAAIIPAVYMPVGFMLTALIFRGVAFEFRFKAGPRGRKFWDHGFHWGSVVAAFSQGVVLGTFVQGIPLQDGQYAGGAFDWLSPLSLLSGAGVVFGYGLLGACWLIVKTEGALEKWARLAALVLTVLVLLAMAAVSLWMVMFEPQIAARWGLAWPNIDWGVFAKFAPVPVITGLLALVLVVAVIRNLVWSPYLAAVGLFAVGYAGMLVSLYPNIVPHELTIWQTAAAPSSQLVLLAGVVVMIPIILAYTAYSYWVFRGKLKEGEGYH